VFVAGNFNKLDENLLLNRERKENINFLVQ